MAIKALLDQPAAADSTRATARRALRLEASGLASGVGAANVTIHNISATGMLIETALSLVVGEQLAIDLPEAGIVAAVIVWRSERLCGCAFERELGLAALAAVQLQGATITSKPTPDPVPTSAVPLARGGEALGVRLNKLRRDAGLTLADVAATLGVSKPTVWAWEKGKARPLPERLGAIAAALGVPADTLAETALFGSDIGALVDDCRQRIADAYGTQPKSVRIVIEL